ncbi:hypothetical protein LTR65_000909 [Meristemomyces frigidus]
MEVLLRFDRTLSALQNAKADSKIEFEGKTALVCALSNAQPFDVVSSFLSTSEWKALNAKHNLYKDAFGSCYSATMYIKRGVWQGRAEDRERHLDLLSRKDAETGTSGSKVNSQKVLMVFPTILRSNRGPAMLFETNTSYNSR